MSINRQRLGAVPFVLLCLFSLPARANDDKAVDRALQVIRQSRLLSSKQLECVFLTISNNTGTVATVDVREKHNKKCGGDQTLAPRIFSLEIDLKTGAAQWDNNTEMEMRPILRSR